MAADIKRLRSEHASLAALAAEMGALADPKQPNPAAISALRWRLCRELLAHLSAEDTLLYPRLFASPEAETARIANEFVRDMGGLSKTFTLYMENGTGERMSSQWREFCRETNNILAALNERIRKENTLLYPLAERIVAPARARRGAA